MHTFIRTFILFVSMIFAHAVMALSYTQSFSEEQLQNQLEAMMPVERQQLFIRLIVSNPDIDLLASSNEIALKADIKALAPTGDEGNGTLQVQGSIRYEQESGAFYFANPQITSMHIERLDERFLPQVQQLAQVLISSVLEKEPLFVFDDTDMQQKMAKAMLKSVTVKDNQLVVELSAF